MMCSAAWTNDCWLLSERLRIQTKGLQTLTSAYFSAVLMLGVDVMASSGAAREF